jgi:SAM-dependent methyltransferase
LRKLRKLFRKCKMRIFGGPKEVKKPKGWLNDEEDKLTPERDLWQDPNEPISHYYRWIWEYLAYLPLLCDVRRDSKILEIGCSHGRTSRGLLHYIRSPGGYCGFDIDQAQIQEATNRITSLAPNFQYVHTDIYSRNYNPAGTISAVDFTFPFDDAAFDCIYAASVFTHLLPEETANYFKQAGRVLKEEGRALFSFFVLDYYKGPGSTISTNYEFDHSYGEDREIGVKYPEFPDAVIAYSERRIKEYADLAGLKVIRIIQGLWSNSPGVAVNEQDLVVLAR